MTSTILPKPEVYLLNCDIDIENFISSNLSEIYSIKWGMIGSDMDGFNNYGDAYAVVINRDGLSQEYWDQYIDFRYGQKQDTNWLILLDEDHYELPLDKHLHRAKSDLEVFNILAELYKLVGWVSVFRVTQQT